MEAASEVVQMRIADVRCGAYDVEPFIGQVVLLEEVNGDGQLPHLDRGSRGHALARLLQNLESPRPMAPQFMFNALHAVGARVVEVRIDRLADNTFYAVAVLEGPSGTSEVDARPSDALNVARRSLDARITVRRVVLEAAAPEAAATVATLAEKFPNTARDISGSLQFVFVWA